MAKLKPQYTRDEINRTWHSGKVSVLADILTKAEPAVALEAVNKFLGHLQIEACTWDNHIKQFVYKSNNGAAKR